MTPLQLFPGAVVVFRPRTPHERAGQSVTVVRPPREDVRSATVRVRFSDGHEASVPVSQLHRQAPAVEVSAAALQDARRRPGWPRLLNWLDDLEALSQAWADAQRDLHNSPHRTEDEEEYSSRTLTTVEAQLAELQGTLDHRLAQLAGSVDPGADAARRSATVAALLVGAKQDAAARKVGRMGVPKPPLVVLPPGLHRVDPAWLDQEQRALINTIARCIHLRYFLPEPREGTVFQGDDESATPGGQGGAQSAAPPLSQKAKEDAEAAAAKQIAARAQVRWAGRAEGISIEQPSPKEPRASVVHGELDEARLAMNAAAGQVCQYLSAGKTEHADAQLQIWQAAQLKYLKAERIIAANRIKDHTGSYFHGDVLSVRQVDDAGGMTQWYTRLVVTYSGRGHEVVIANARELEARTNTSVGRAWGDLARWIEDLSERRDGRKRGRRQDDDTQLIYREQHGSLTVRDSILADYPLLPEALECIRRSLTVNDVKLSEIPASRPGPGYHPPRQSERDVEVVD